MDNMPITIPLEQAQKTSSLILLSLAEEETTVVAGVVGCGLSIARLLTLEREMSDEEELEWLEGMLEFCSAYFVKVPSGVKES